jgi:hypothetical protein
MSLNPSKEEMLRLGSNVYKVGIGAEASHLAAARALAEGGGMIDLSEDAPVPNEGAPPSDAIAALQTQLSATLGAVTAERDTLLEALKSRTLSEQWLLVRVAELEAKYESAAKPAAAAAKASLAPEPESEVIEATFTEKGSLGLKLNEHDPGDASGKRALVVKLNAGSQAEAHPQLSAGLFLAKVGVDNVRGLAYSEILGLLKAASRPVTLAFERKQETLSERVPEMRSLSPSKLEYDPADGPTTMAVKEDSKALFDRMAKLAAHAEEAEQRLIDSATGGGN